MRVGVIGASGYAGTELLRLCSAHPALDVVLATGGARAGQRVADNVPALARAYPDLSYRTTDAPALDDLVGLDAVFLALPHGQSQDLMGDLAERGPVVVDLAADFRLRDATLYPRWYGEEHRRPDLLARFVYGLPELFRDRIAGSRLIAAPGCYPTAAALALAPLVQAGLVERQGIVVDAASGMSGAGRGPSDRLHFGTVDENFTAYGLLDHRHTPEIEQTLSAQVLFTPHLAPMVRGILATCYARPTAAGADLDTAGALAVLDQAYRTEPFVVVTEGPPSTKATTGSNCAHVTVRVDPRTGWVVSLCALDNLVKGAAGQAIQCANLALGRPETEGLPIAGMWP